MISSTAIDELGAEVRAQRVHHLALDSFVDAAIAEICEERASKVRRHDDDGVLEIDRPPLAVGEAAVIEQLEQHVQHFGMRLFDLVEQHDRVGTAAHRFRQLSGLLIADVSWRRAEQTRNRVLLLVFRHVDADHRVLVVEQERRQRARELSLAHARRSQKDEAAERAIRVLQTCACAPNRIRDRANGLVLPDDALMDALFHVDELLDFSLHQTADRDVRPLADDVGDVLLVDLFLEHRLALLGRRRNALLFGAHHPLELGQTAVLQLGRLAIVAAALRALDLQAQLLELFLELALALDGFLFLLPARHQRRVLFLEIGELFLELLAGALSRPCLSLFAAPRARSRAASRGG